MNYSLIDHNRGYQITSRDALFSMLTGFSGAPYALRHHQLAKVENAPRWGHRLICLAEFVPVLGLLVALIERVVYALLGSGYSDVPWRGKTISLQSAMEEMKGKAISAAAQHYISSGVYATPKEVEAEFGMKHAAPLRCSHDIHEAQSFREKMEDAHFYKEMENGILAGVFDGHGDKEVSAFASAEFQKRFPKALEDAKGNVHEAFENLIHHIHQDIVRHPNWNGIGSTAVICYIDTETHRVYTATLGDSEANIYRRSLWGRVKSIPLSRVQDWIGEKVRLVKVFGEKNVEAWLKRCGYNPKGVRSQLSYGVNVSRAFGDVDQTGTPEAPLVIHKPEITVYDGLRSGDELILACDGLKDFVDETDITSIVGKVKSLSSRVFGEKSTLAQELVTAALKKMTPTSCDNVTVLNIHVA